MRQKSFSPVATLEQIIAPISLEKFVEEYWEKNYLFIQRNDPEYYNLFSVENFENLLHFGNPRESVHDIQASRLNPINGDEERYYLDSWDRDYWVKIRSFYKEGYTLLFNYVERRNANVAALTKNLELFFGAYCWANIFFAPMNADQNFPTHYDAVEIFVLQLHGSKRWRVYEPQIELPHVALLSPKVRTQELNLLLDIEMQPGDMLYVPRGFIHDVCGSKNDIAMHMTISVEPCRWMDVLLEAAQNLARSNVEFRRSFRVLGELSKQISAEQLEEQFKKLISEFLTKADFLEAKGGIEAEIISKTLPLPCNQFNIQKQVVTLERRYRKRENLLFSFNQTDKSNRKVEGILHYSGNSVSVSKEFVPAVKFMITKEIFTPSDLPGKLTDQQRIEIICFLIEQGFLTPK